MMSMTNSKSRTDEEFIVRRLDRSDLPTMTAIHLAAFDRASLTRLGKGAVLRYYEWQMFGPHRSFSIGAFIDEVMVGFCVGGLFNGAFSGFIEKHFAYLTARVMMKPWLLLYGEFRDRIVSGIRALARRRSGTTIGNVKQYSANAMSSLGILVICTHPRYHRSGAGRALLAEAEKIARQNGHKRMHLTVHPDNAIAVAFYEKLGWVRLSHNRVWQGTMVKELTV
jgi:ribosomal protein S18 acetylase RimI-like enzyme